MRGSSRAKPRGIVGDEYYGYRSDLLGEVTATLERFGAPPKENRIRLVQGDFRNTLRVEGPVAVAHLDGDWYESTMVCLERIWPHVQSGGRLVVDDYEAWSGCRKAIDEYFSSVKDARFEWRSRLHVVRS